MGCGASSANKPRTVAPEQAAPDRTIAADSIISLRKASTLVSPEHLPEKTVEMQAWYGNEQRLPGVHDASRVGTFSSHGLKPGLAGLANAKINQDRGLITYPFADNTDEALFCVFDGHGSNGENVAEFVMWKIQEGLLNRSKDIVRDFKNVFESVFEDADRMLSESAVSSTVSGSAGVVVFAHKETLITANVGDSRAVLGEFSRETGELLAVHGLSEDQKPDDPKEMQRILKAGGYVSPASPQHGPPRVWLRKGEGPGLAMSRSLGDHICRSAGVIPTPEVNTFTMDPTKEYTLIVASDGVWEFIDNHQAIDIASKASKAADACVALIDESSRRWREAEGNYRDDITAIACRFPFFAPKATSGGDENSFKTHSFSVKPEGLNGDSEASHTIATTTSAEQTGGVENTGDGDVEEDTQEANDEDGSTFVKRRLTLHTNLAEGDEQLKRLEELKREFGDKDESARAPDENE